MSACEGPAAPDGSQLELQHMCSTLFFMRAHDTPTHKTSINRAHVKHALPHRSTAFELAPLAREWVIPRARPRSPRRSGLLLAALPLLLQVLALARECALRQRRPLQAAVRVLDDADGRHLLARACRVALQELRLRLIDVHLPACNGQRKVHAASCHTHHTLVEEKYQASTGAVPQRNRTNAASRHCSSWEALCQHKCMGAANHKFLNYLSKGNQAS